MTEPTEAEVEAAYLELIFMFDAESTPEDRKECIRAALTAAAQVRERAGNATEKCPWPSGCLLTKPALLPIYGATEDQGPDVLGIREPGEG